MNTASIFKKMATIVALVGAGLLAAPLEQAEAQSSIPVVFDVLLESNAASDYELSRGYYVHIPLMDSSSWTLEWARGSLYPVAAVGNYSVNGGGGSGWFLFRPKNGRGEPIMDGRWILVVFHISVSWNSRASLSVLVTDSEGNEYIPSNVEIRYSGWKGW